MTKRTRRTVAIGVPLLAIVAAGLIIWTGTLSSATKEKTMTYTFPGVLSADQIQHKKAVVVTNKGTFTFELLADAAPKTVSNFVYLASNKFYDGLTFHRFVDGFVIQGGDPTGTGSGGPGYSFPDEPVVGEYTTGAVAMANSGPNTNGSQFFVTLADQTKNLQKQYNLFGRVTEGMDVVQKLRQGDIMQTVRVEAQ